MSFIKKYLVQFKEEFPVNITGIDFLCHLFFAIWLTLAILFYKERILPYDGSYYTFNIVNFKSFFMPHGRWGVALSQLPALIAVYLNCSLKTIIITYSTTNIIYNYCFYLVIRYVLKNVELATALAVSLCLCCRYMFYFVPSDINPGFGPIFLLAAFISNSKDNNTGILKMLVVSFLNIWLIFIHPIYIFVIVFIYGSFIVNNKFRVNKIITVGLVSFLLFFVLKLIFIQSNSYEANKIPSLAIILEQLPQIYSLTSFTFFIFFSIKQFIVAYLLSAFTILILFVRKQWLNLIFFVGFVFSFIVLVIITYYKGESPIMHETYYVLCGILISFAFLNFGLKALQPKVQFLLLLLVFTSNTYAIYNCKNQISSRFSFFEVVETQQKKLNTNKFILSKSNFDNDVIWSDWDLGLESLIYSNLKDPDNAYTISSVFNDEQKHSMFNDKAYLAGPYFEGLKYNQSNLDTVFFKFNFVSIYKPLVKEVYPRVLTDLIINFTQDTLCAKIAGSYMNKLQFEMNITNHSKDTLFATHNFNDFYEFEYKIIDGKGKELKIENRNSPLLVDVYPGKSEIMPMSIKLPYKKGFYRIFAVIKFKNDNIASAKETIIDVY